MRTMIAGICRSSSINKISFESLKNMREAMRHQPSSDEGIWEDLGIGLAGLRFRAWPGPWLQSNEDKSIWILADADILNLGELQRAHVSNNPAMAEKDKAAVLPALYERLGVEFLKELNGYFALVVWDSRKKELLLARDRYGSRPLYYAARGDQLLFASEIKALLASGFIETKLDIEGFVEYFTFQTNLGDRTWFEGIRLLPPGRILRFRHGQIHENSYWDLQYIEDEEWSEDILQETLLDQLDRTVKRQVSSRHAAVGSFLSGGLDTGCINAFASRYIKRLPTFHCGYDMNNVISEEMKFSETEQARQLADLLGTEYHEIILTPSDLENSLSRVVWHLESPRINMSYPNFLVGQMASRRVDIVLTGTGGDEFFGSYPWRYSQILGASERTTFEPLYYKLRARLISQDRFPEAFSADILGHLGNFSLVENFGRIMKPVQARDPLHWAMYFDVKTAVHDLLLVDTQLNAAHGLACRSPLLDNELISLVLRIPARYKFNRVDFKYILKKALKGILPDDILQRPKIGFIPPDGSWYRGPLREYVQELLLEKKALGRGYFKKDYLREIVSEHMSGKVNHRSLLWSLMCFEWWNRLFLDKEPLPDFKTIP